MAKQKALWQRSKEELLLLIRNLARKNEELTKKLKEKEESAPLREADPASIDRLSESIDRLRLTIENTFGKASEASEAEERDE